MYQQMYLQDDAIRHVSVGDTLVIVLHYGLC